jgi:DNA primase
MSDYHLRRAKRIKEKAPLLELLQEYGYDVTLNGERDQQFSCDLHGDGVDGKPSARVYGDSYHWYCFACGKRRDVISTVMEKEGLSFSMACRALEKKYNIAFEMPDRPKALDIGIRKSRGRNVTSEDLERFLQLLTDERSLSMAQTLKLWESFDAIETMFKAEKIDEKKHVALLSKLRTNTQKLLSGE